MKQNVSTICYCLDNEIRFYFREKKNEFRISTNLGDMDIVCDLNGLQVGTGIIVCNWNRNPGIHGHSKNHYRFVIVTSLNTT